MVLNNGYFERCGRGVPDGLVAGAKLNEECRRAYEAGREVEREKQADEAD